MVSRSADTVVMNTDSGRNGKLAAGTHMISPVRPVAKSLLRSGRVFDLYASEKVISDKNSEMKYHECTNKRKKCV